MVTMPPDVVRMRASSTVFVKASSLVKRDLADIFLDELRHKWEELPACHRGRTARGGNATGSTHD